MKTRFLLQPKREADASLSFFFINMYSTLVVQVWCRLVQRNRTFEIRQWPAS